MTTMQTTGLDQTDIQLLRLLQENSSLNNKELAAKVNKAITPTYMRVKRLKEEGYIKGYTAVLNREKLGMGLLALTQVKMKCHSEELLKGFEQEVNQMPEVITCFHLSGAYDFIIHVALTDMKAYHDFLMHKLFHLPEIETVNTCFVIKECKVNSPYRLLPA